MIHLPFSLPCRHVGILALLLFVKLPSKADESAAAAQPATDSRMDNQIQLYEADFQSVRLFYDNIEWAPSYFERLDLLLEQWKSRIAYLDFDSLDQHGRIDYLLLQNEIAASRLRLKRERQKQAGLDELLPFRPAIENFERARWRLDRCDPKAAASTVARIAEQTKMLRKRLEKGRQPPTADAAANGKEMHPDTADKEPPAPLEVEPVLAMRAARTLDQVRESFKAWFSFYDGYHPEFSWWVKKPYDDAAAALEEYAKHLREEIAGIKGKEEDPLLGQPIGADALAEELAAEWIPYSAEELIALGEREFSWCEERMKEAAREMGLGADWQSALARVKSQFVPPGEQDELVRDVAQQAIRFVKEHDLVTVPPLCEETWRLAMSSPEMQKTMPYVAYSGTSMLVAYAKQEMKHEDKLMAMRGNNRHFTRITTAHELIPGHHLQAFAAARHRPHREVFSTPFFVEGWALYWEMLLWDKGYGQSPEDRVGMLFWRMHRAARVIVSLKFHLGRMKPEEMIAFLIDRVGHEKLGATSEVRRFIESGSLYECSYLLGGLQLKALHEAMVGTGKTSDREFNDALLEYNAIPIELIRAEMLGLPLTRATRASWKFAGDLPAAR